MNIYREPYQHFPRLSERELRGTEGIEVELVNFPTNPYTDIFIAQQMSWRTSTDWTQSARQNISDFSSRKDEIKKLLENIRDGKVWAGQALEGSTFTFLIKNISRSCTHQIVRTRIGASFMQESGREGAWHICKFVTPLSILRDDKAHADYVELYERSIELYREWTGYNAYERYDSIPPNDFIPIQDARSIVPHAVTQNLWAGYSLQALIGVCSSRLCTTMQWEINTVARMMRDAVLEKFPLLGTLLKSNCEQKGGCKSLTPHYGVGAENNGCSVYFPHEGRLCGKAGKFSDEEIAVLLQQERL